MAGGWPAEAWISSSCSGIWRLTCHPRRRAPPLPALEDRAFSQGAEPASVSPPTLLAPTLGVGLYCLGRSASRARTGPGTAPRHSASRTRRTPVSALPLTGPHDDDAWKAAGQTRRRSHG